MDCHILGVYMAVRVKGGADCGRSDEPERRFLGAWCRVVALVRL